MSHPPILKEAEQQTTRQRVNFRDDNHALHLQVFLEWLPVGLHDAPYIDWAKLPGRVMAYLVNTVDKSPFAAHMALVAGAGSEPIDAFGLHQYIQTLYRFLRNIQTVCGSQSAAALTKDVWKSMVARTGVTQNLYRGFRTYHTITENLLPGYLEQLTPKQRAQIEDALLPRLPHQFIRRYFPGSELKDAQQQRRKDKSDVLAPLHTLLVALVRF